ncbi:hypothetical protein HNP46_005796 [Pseudomonas nitritireducens]|uniref:Uncharacterized protein n=1 Tax=Pseudomonas nitroreducens TaxID=46680 RepID=A0A7W7KQV0_PSENT|nr:hypothetical protein [Pseudomonas nitritireducens]MBB4866889.1 hypothetical protein [Pseudomonas nitritireducens]
MEVKASMIPAGDGEVLYLLNDYEGLSISGILKGPAGFDFEAQFEVFREEAYAKAESEGESFCYPSASDFEAWLRETGRLNPVPAVGVTITTRESLLRTPYEPSHWEDCPSCRKGKGDHCQGDILSHLNRQHICLKCTRCGFKWNHQAVPCDEKLPMVDDDGSFTRNGCVPYTVSKVTGIPFTTILPLCIERGWDESGMDYWKAIELMKKLGFNAYPRPLTMIQESGKKTLNRLLNALRPDRTYIVATHGHWLPVVKGQNLDNNETHLGTLVQMCWEVLPA